MKTVLIFTGLKIAEIGGVFGIYYLFCLLGEVVYNDYFWLDGFRVMYLIALIAMILFVVGFGAYELIKKNIEWAKKLGGKV